jgi:hypothetical protein
MVLNPSLGWAKQPPEKDQMAPANKTPETLLNEHDVVRMNRAFRASQLRHEINQEDGASAPAGIRPERRRGKRNSRIRDAGSLNCW